MKQTNKKKKRTRQTPGAAALAEILELRRQMDTGEITPHQFASLLQREAFRTEWTARVQLRAIARDLLPKAATLARKGRARLLGLLTKIFLTTETADIKKMAALYAKPQQVVLLHNIPRPDRSADTKTKAESPARRVREQRASKKRKA